MKVVAAYLLAVLGGNANPDADAITKILGSVGVEADAERVQKLVSELKGKDVYEVIAAGQSKLASVPSGGAARGAAPAASGAAPTGAAAPAAKKEEKKEEKEEEDEDMGFGLFD